MIVTVRDPDVLSSLDPKTLARYLQATGWHEQSRIDEQASVWIKMTSGGEEFEIVLPSNSLVRAFALRMYEILETLEIAEQRSQLDILGDLITTVPHTEIKGMVIQLQEEQHLLNVAMMGFVVSQPRKIHLHLNEPAYNLAVKAYQKRLPVVCKGDLIKERSEFVLKNPHNFGLDKEWTD